jgi:BirA family transcriptional regulator, biotin operon repressor / biotin---[acetyl-CoA-carboxylase] ligase
MIRQLHVNECDSTQDLLKEQMSSMPAEDSLLVSCNIQNKGRGRGENVWIDSPGTLCFSMILEAHEKPSFTALEISLLVVRFFQLQGKTLSLKWPNDMLNSESKKCGGILIQNSQNRMLAGIGIDLFIDNPDYGSIYDTPFAVDKKTLAREIGTFISLHRYQNTAVLKADWSSFCAHLNRKVTIIENDEKTTGVFLGLGEYGEALLQTPQGEKKLFNGSLRF